MVVAVLYAACCGFLLWAFRGFCCGAGVKTKEGRCIDSFVK